MRNTTIGVQGAQAELQRKWRKRLLRSIASSAEGNALQWEAKKDWRVLAHGGPFATWWCLYAKIRTDLQGGGGACAERSRSMEPPKT
jgi:hypothetical protein